MTSMPCIKKIYIFIALLIASAALAIGLGGCFNNKTPERSYFSVDYMLGTQPKHAKPKYNYSLVIQNVSSALAYDRQEIVYRNNPYEFKYYWYRLWASKPRKMMRELITAHLRYTQMFANVSTTIEDKLPDYALDVEIQSIEELDASPTEWYAHLSLQFALQRLSDNKTVWNYSFDAKRPVASNQPVYVVKAMSELLDEELVKAFEDMDKTLSKKLQASSNDEVTQPSASEPEISPDDQAAEPENQPKATLKNKKVANSQQP